MSDAHIEKNLLRVSVGVEDVEDLKEDIRRGCEALAKEAQGEVVV